MKLTYSIESHPIRTSGIVDISPVIKSFLASESQLLNFMILPNRSRITKWRLMTPPHVHFSGTLSQSKYLNM